MLRTYLPAALCLLTVITVSSPIGAASATRQLTIRRAQALLAQVGELEQVHNFQQVRKVIAQIKEFQQELPSFYRIASPFLKESHSVAWFMDNEVVCTKVLTRCALNTRISSSEFALLVKLLAALYGYNIVQRALNAVLLEFVPFNGDPAVHRYFMKILEDVALLAKVADNIQELLPQVAEEALCVSGLDPRVTAYLIEKFPQTMLQQAVFNAALKTFSWTLQHNGVYIDSTSNVIYKEHDRAKANLMMLHEHCKRNNALHHTSLAYISTYHQTTFNWLLDHGYNPNVKDEQGRTALDLLYEWATTSYWSILMLFEGFNYKPTPQEVERALLLKQHGAMFGNKRRAEKWVKRALWYGRYINLCIDRLQELLDIMKDIPELPNAESIA